MLLLLLLLLLLLWILLSLYHDDDTVFVINHRRPKLDTNEVVVVVVAVRVFRKAWLLLVNIIRVLMFACNAIYPTFFFKMGLMLLYIRNVSGWLGQRYSCIGVGVLATAGVLMMKGFSHFQSSRRFFRPCCLCW